MKYKKEKLFLIKYCSINYILRSQVRLNNDSIFTENCISPMHYKTALVYAKH